jgi:hypothetical protein
LPCVAQILLATALATAQVQTPAKPGSVEGTVVNVATGGPVRKARVTLRDDQRSIVYATNAGEDGRFLFPSVEPGPYLAFAECDGFTVPRGSRTPTGAPVSVAEGQEVRNVSLKLSPLGAIGGKVTGDDGEPIPRATVSAQYYFYYQGTQWFRTLVSTTTDDRGVYRFIKVPPGRYYLRASLRTAPPVTLEHTHSSVPEAGYIAAYYPAVDDLTQAAAIDIAPGVTLDNIDFRLRSTPLFHIRGRVVDDRKRPLKVLPSIEVCGAAELGTYSEVSVKAAPDGTFDASGIWPGRYCVKVSDYLEEGAWRYAAETITVSDQTVSGMVIVASSVPVTRGTLRVEGKPLDQLGKMKLLLWGNDDYAYRELDRQPDGSFVRSLVPGAYEIGISGTTPGVYLKSVNFNGQPLPNGKFVVGPTGGDLIVVLGTDPGQVNGTVLDAEGNPGAGMLITLEPQGDRAGSFEAARFFTTAADGRFQFDDVIPADYKVFAWEGGDIGVARFPAFLKQFEARGVAVTVHPSSHESVTVKAVSAAEFDAARATLR